MKSSLLTLNNGVEIPALGLGVFQSPPEETATAVESAIGAGYRLLDTAAAYFNERGVGEGIRRCGVDRSELFVTTKLWISDYGYDSALRAFDTSLAKLGLEFLDLYLLHWPLPSELDRTLQAYRAAETLLAEGRVRAIGVCNHKPEHLRTLIERTEVVPAVNQVELHPVFAQPDVVAANQAAGVLTQAWSPIGGINHYSEAADASLNPLTDSTIVGIARVHGRSPAQVLLRWHLQQGRCVIPKSVRPERIRENIDVFGFELSETEMAEIDRLDRGRRGGPDPDLVDMKRLELVIDPA